MFLSQAECQSNVPLQCSQAQLTTKGSVWMEAIPLKTAATKVSLLKFDSKRVIEQFAQKVPSRKNNYLNRILNLSVWKLWGKIPTFLECN